MQTCVCRPSRSQPMAPPRPSPFPQAMAWPSFGQPDQKPHSSGRERSFRSHARFAHAGWGRQTINATSEGTELLPRIPSTAPRLAPRGMLSRNRQSKMEVWETPDFQSAYSLKMDLLPSPNPITSINASHLVQINFSDPIFRNGCEPAARIDSPGPLR